MNESALESAHRRYAEYQKRKADAERIGNVKAVTTWDYCARCVEEELEVLAQRQPENKEN